MSMIETFLRYERGRYDREQPGLNWLLIVALVLNFGIWIGGGAIAWWLFR